MIDRIFLLVCITAACVYGMLQVRNGMKKKYFLVALCGMAALLLARLYYLSLVLSDGTDQALTVGTLGQLSAYLFFLTANVRFVTRAILRESRHKICIPALIGTLQLCAIFLLAAYRLNTVSGFIGEGLYMLVMGLNFYSAVNTMSYRSKIEKVNRVYGFNICVCILLEGNAIGELMSTFDISTAWTVCYTALVLISGVTVLAMLPILKRGIDRWAK